MKPARTPFSPRGKLLLLLTAAVILTVPALVLTRVPPPAPAPTATPTPTFLPIWEALERLPTPPPPTPVPTPTPQPTPRPSDTPVPAPAVTLRKGDQGEAVRLMQEALIRLGYLGADGADGNFGRGTEAAVRAFQRRSGLKEDGVAGPNTLGLLFGE